MDKLAHVMGIKSALMVTTHTQGWRYFKQLADKAVANAIQSALDEEDRDKGEMKRLKAKAMQEGFNEIFAAVEATLAFNPEADQEDNLLGELETETVEL